MWKQEYDDALRKGAAGHVSVEEAKARYEENMEIWKTLESRIRIHADGVSKN